MSAHERRESVAYQVHDERRYRLLQGKEVYAVTPLAFTEDVSNDEGRTRGRRVPHLEGLRGILAVQTLLWIFFRVFCPGVVDATIEGAPRWTMIVRKVLSPLLFDGSLQAAAYMLLVGRVALLTYLERREAIDLAGPCFRRPFRLLIPTAIALAITSGLVAGKGFAYSQYMADHLNNPAASPPPIWGSTVEYFNSLASLFFSPAPYTNSRAVTFLQPAGISWYIVIAFQQLYVLIIFAWTLPYTVLRYKIIGLTALILLSAWVGRWSWYTVTGLAMAEFSVVYRQTLHPKPRVTVGSRRIPLYLFPLAMFLVGVMFKYLWAGLPQYADRELVAHANVNTAKLDWDALQEHKAVPRYDDYLVCVGLLGLVELSHSARRVLSWRPLTYLGRLGFSIALTSGLIMVSLGSVVYYCLVESLGFQAQSSSTTAVLFFIFVPLCLVCADIYSRLVDDVSLWASRFLFHFFRT
ncbi:hypothetical protein FA10DRAFT_246498 [Acaromyces ingoldii]|uniref:Acyltransferase 3 domain-containing protein n=1 Tax=Acaromyces ingoldii TaxID=215250 RepID=A0A316YSX3_9BASI|nr:hypothetical protein FA10DRAFT_246498 [Acaromyces ingoldii]PWN92650.1 hypothetical protein FA10DRAFT_246498 [Acaromyces ingoldii]